MIVVHAEIAVNSEAHSTPDNQLQWGGEGSIFFQGEELCRI